MRLFARALNRPVAGDDEGRRIIETDSPGKKGTPAARRKPWRPMHRRSASTAVTATDPAAPF